MSVHGLPGPLMPEQQCPECREPLTRLCGLVVCLSLAGCTYERSRLTTGQQGAKRRPAAAKMSKARRTAESARRLLDAVQAEPWLSTHRAARLAGVRPETARSVLHARRGAEVQALCLDGRSFRWALRGVPQP